MTQLQAIINNHMSLECRCGHQKPVSVTELINSLSPTANIYDVARKAILDREFGCKFAVLYHYIRTHLEQ